MGEVVKRRRARKENLEKSQGHIKQRTNTKLQRQKKDNAFEL